MLHLNDQVRVKFKANTGETDAHNNPITTTVDAVVPAAVWSLGSKDGAGLAAIGRYRMILAPNIDIPAAGWTSLSLHWRDFDGQTNSALGVDGTIDHVMARGRLHHYELTTTSIT